MQPTCYSYISNHNTCFMPGMELVSLQAIGVLVAKYDFLLNLGPRGLGAFPQGQGGWGHSLPPSHPPHKDLCSSVMPFGAECLFIYHAIWCRIFVHPPCHLVQNLCSYSICHLVQNVCSYSMPFGAEFVFIQHAIWCTLERKQHSLVCL